MLLSCSYGENRLFWVVIVNWTSLTVKHIALKVQRTKCIIIYHLRKWLFKSLLEKCEDTTGVIIDCMSIKGNGYKDKHWYTKQKKRLSNTHPTKTDGEFGCFGRVSISCSTGDTNLGVFLCCKVLCCSIYKYIWWPQ